MEAEAQMEAECELSVSLIEAEAPIESRVWIYARYSCNSNGLFHFEVWFLVTNVTEEYVRLREGPLCQREGHTTSNSSLKR